jgi:aminopeptidase N
MKPFIGLIFFHLSLLSYSQSQEKVDFTHAKVALEVYPEDKRIMGEVVYRFLMLEAADSVFLDAQQMQFSSVKLNKRKVEFLNTQTKIIIKHKFKKGKTYSLTLAYMAHPKQTVYFIGGEGPKENRQVWTQGQGKYTSHWLPSFDDMNEKVEFDLQITFDPDYEVIANGKLMDTKESDSLKTWYFDMEKPMSSYLLAFVAGKYKKKTATSLSGIPIEMYYYPADSLNVEPTYRYTKDIFDFMEAEIGVHYPWQNYKQIPVRDFLYAGMENTGATIFSDAFAVDSVAFEDKNYVNVNAHELAHQWFGNMVTEVDGNHHWLHEGFATYYALLAEKEIFGESHFYWKLFESANQLNSLSLKGEGESLTNPKASSLTFYEKGAWALVILKEFIGEKNFKKGIQNYLMTHQFKNVTLSDFLSEMEHTSGADLSAFKQNWLYTTEFPMREAKSYLIKGSQEVSDYYKMQQQLITSAIKKEEVLQTYWNQSASNRFKKELISSYSKSLSESFLQRAFTTGEVKIRQALALHLQPIPIALKADYESLLEDRSYYTLEHALYSLWIYFPAERHNYLEKTKHLVGFPNKNIRILWLTLAILTKDYDSEKKELYLTELRGYTSANYALEIRQLAFQYIEEAIGFTDRNLLDLINATVHHSWQFKKFARDMVDRLLMDANYKIRITTLKKELNEEELRYITTKLKVE